VIANQELKGLDEKAYACFAKGLFFAARECLELWCDVVAQQEPERVCEALNALGSVYIELGQFQRALDLFTKSLNWDKAGSEIDRVRSLCNISLCCHLMGRAAECVSYGEQAYQRLIAQCSQNPSLEAHTQEILSLGYVAVGDWEKARTAGEAVRKSFEAMDNQAGLAKALNNLGLIHVETGRFDDGERLLNASLSLTESIQDFGTVAYTYTELGRLHYKRGDVALALHFGSKALRLLWDNVGMIDKAEVARLCELFGSISFSIGDRQGAINYLQRASTYYAQSDRWREWQSSNEALNKIIIADSGEPIQKIAIDIEDRQLLRYFTTLLGLMDTLESLYPELRGKSELVTKYALLLGERCGVEGSNLERLSHAARLHNIGLTSMDPQGAQCIGVSTEDSDALAHPIFGERVLKMFGAHEDVQKAVRHHREWFDGSGIPDGLRGSDIPLFSRIIAVAEAYVSTVMARSDPKRSHTEGMALVIDQAGKRFDPAIIEAFVALHEMGSR